MVVLMSVGTLSLVIRRGHVCSLLALGKEVKDRDNPVGSREQVNQNGDTMSLLLVFGIMPFPSFPAYSLRRKRHEGDKGGASGIYLEFDYICFGDFFVYTS